MRIPFGETLHRLARDCRGTIAIITAVSMLALLTATAFAVDMGSVYVAKRTLQGAADDAALAAVNMPNDSQGAVLRTINANHLGGASPSAVTGGSYTANANLAPSARFVAGGTPANATQVALAQNVPIYFGGIFSGRHSVRITASAKAARIDYAAFSIGTRLAAIQGGLPNALLSGLAGTNLNVSVADYNSLLGTQVNLLSFSQQLGTQLHLTGADFNTILSTSITLPQALSALAAVENNGSGATATQSIAAQVPGTTIRLSDLIDLGPYGSQDHADPDTAITVDGYSLVREMLALGNGQRQVALNLGISLPGLASSTATLAIGQRMAHSPWLTVTSDNSVVVSTAQSRLYLDTQIGGAATLGLLSFRLPVYIQLAEGQAKLAAISCSGGSANTTVSLDVLPAVGHIAIADLDMTSFSNFSTPLTEKPAVIANTLIASVTVGSSITLGGVNWQRVNFSAAEIAANTVKTVSTNDLTQGIASSLLTRMTLKATLLNTGINLTPLANLVGAALTPLAPTLDALVDQVTGLLGVHVGQADVRIDGVRCGKPTLVG